MNYYNILILSAALSKTTLGIDLPVIDIHILVIDKLGLKTRNDAQEAFIKMSHIIKNFVYSPQKANI